MIEFLEFIGKLGNELFELFQYAKRGKPDPEEEKQIAMRIVRKAVDEQAKKEIPND